MGEEEVAVVVEDPVQESAPEVPQEEIPEEIPEEGPAAKDKVKDEFAERERLKKEEEAKIIITPAVLPVKKEEESEEESEEEEEPEPVKKKLSLSALKPAVQIKMEIPAEEPPTRRRKAARDPSVDEGFLANIPEVPKVQPAPVIEEEAITVEAVAAVESIPEEGPAAKDKVKDEFAERERIKKE